MRISVVTPTYNKLPLLRRTLASLERQDIDASGFEVVVVDDGSTDGTAEFLREYRPPFGLRTVRAEENRGRSAARNRGLERATGDLVVFLDDDMEVVPGFLDAHRAAHEESDRVMGIGNVSNHPEIRQGPIDRYLDTRGVQKIRGRGPIPWRYFSTNNSSVLRAELEAVGGFDERFIHYGFEDLELAYRLEKERGLGIRFVEGARSLHIHAHTLEEALAKKTLCGRHSMPYLFGKHPEARREMRYDRFEAPRAGDPLGLNLKRALFRLLLTRPVYVMVRPLARFDLGAATTLAIDYLVLYHYLEGMKRPLVAGTPGGRSPGNGGTGP